MREPKYKLGDVVRFATCGDIVEGKITNIIYRATSQTVIYCFTAYTSVKTGKATLDINRWEKEDEVWQGETPKAVIKYQLEEHIRDLQDSELYWWKNRYIDRMRDKKDIEEGISHVTECIANCKEKINRLEKELKEMQ